jgi:hypothetical protein
MEGQDVEITLTIDADPDRWLRCAVCGLLPSEHKGPNGYGFESPDGRRGFVWSDACLAAVPFSDRRT